MGIPQKLFFLTKWLVAIAKADYGASLNNGQGWLLPDEFGLCLAQRIENNTLKFQCQPPEEAWLPFADEVVVDAGENTLIFVFAGKILFFMPVFGFPCRKIRRILFETAFGDIDLSVSERQILCPTAFQGKIFFRFISAGTI